VTPDTYQTVRKTIRHLRAQKIRDRIEIVLVAPSLDGLGADEKELSEFQGFSVVAVGHMRSTARARAAGVRQARAPIVAFAEDHAFPAPGWAEALIDAHRQEYAAVGPLMANANPGSLTSWANLLVEYGEWLEPRAGGEVEHLPGHNSSYKRDALLEYGERLEEMLDAESILQWDLRAKGHRLYLEPKARTFHENFTAPLSSVVLRFHGGRLFASSRARRWSLWRRIVFTCASPLIPPLRFLRLVRELCREGRPRHLLPRLAPLLFTALVFDGAGEMIGYAFGAGRAMAILSDMEFHRERYMKKGGGQGSRRRVVTDS
jgi:hypothetical protein